MSLNVYPEATRSTEPTPQSTDLAVAVTKLRGQIWAFGVPSWLFGVTDRSLAAFTDGYVSAIELAQLFTAAFFFISWLYLKPEEVSEDDRVSALNPIRWDTILQSQRSYLYPMWSRMMELRDQHLISQDYVLSVPYLCQIYHLLNLKHLESVHNFSLNNLRVIKVSELQQTSIGGRVKFQTVLDSPFNILRIWRQPIVEVDLILHSPYSVELSIPVYGDKRITVLFNALPTSDNEHKFLIDIYGNLGWFKPILQVLLHVAACLTLFEDLPYLQKLAARTQDRLLSSGRVSQQDTMWLYKRFVDLYGASLASTDGATIADQPLRLLKSADPEATSAALGN